MIAKVPLVASIVLVFLFFSIGSEKIWRMIKVDDESTSSTISRIRIENRTSTKLHIAADNSGEQPVTIVVQLAGELGNQIQKLGTGFCMQHLIETKLGLKTEIKLRAQVGARKWRHAMEWTKSAFPNTRPYAFNELNTPEFDRLHKFQNEWIQGLIEKNLLNMTGITHPTQLNELSCNDKKECFDDMLNMLNQTWHMERPNVPSSDGNGTINPIFSIPHVYSGAQMSDYCLDLIYPELRDFFTFDEETNCKLIPDPDETVLHIRNFLAEMPRRGEPLGFQELDEVQTVAYLFADHKPGDKVAIISRLDNNVDKFVQALEFRGLIVRYIKGQSGNEDFCFLLKAQKEMIGTRKSTYALWAGIIGDAKRVRLYMLETPRTKSQGKHYHSYNFTNLKLSERISYENYKQ